MPTRVRDEHGQELDATFSVEGVDGGLSVVFESRGGRRKGPDARNVDYELGLEVLLDRLRHRDAAIETVRLHPVNRALGSELSIARYPTPVELRAVQDVKDLRRAISTAQARTDRAPGAKGSGNPNKRIRIYLGQSTGSDASRLEHDLAGPRPCRYWALFANPKVYRIDDAIAALPEDTWTTKGKPLREGDRALVWRGAGGGQAERGVVAFLEVLSDPELIDESSNPFWIDRESAAAGPELRVRTRYVVPPGLPLLEEGTAKDVLSSLAVARARGGTVFEVTPDQFETVVQAAGGWKDPVDATAALEVLAELNDIEGQRASGVTKPHRSRGQGYGLTKAERDAVEGHAMARATEHFVSSGWQVEDVSKRESYDLVCRKNGQELRVEVKGTTGKGEKILLTKNEVAHARLQYPNLALFVLAEIKLTKGCSPPTCEGGTPRMFHPWRLEDSSLVAVGFEYSIQEASQ